MKTTALSLILLSSIMLCSFSQDNTSLTSKNGKTILPEIGDIAFGVSANPFFSYAGNLFSNSGTNQLNLSLSDNALYGKYFLTPQSAVRVKLSVYREARHFDNEVVNNADPDLMVTDHMDQTFSDFSLSLGYEKRRGAGRLQLFYGGELSITKANEKSVYNYGNSHDTTNTNPTTTTDFYTGDNFRINIRPLEEIETDGLGLGLRAFAGLEYFFLPKISVGGEFGLGYTQYFGGKYSTTVEYWDFAPNALENDISETHRNASYTVSDISSGRIFLLFHF